MQRFVLSLTAIAIFTVLAPALFGQDTSKEDFDTFCEALTGRWVGDVKLVADWPGEGKQGDKITGYAEWRPVADGNALSLVYYGGTGSGVALLMYDAGSKTIRWAGVSSGGTLWNRVVYKKGEQWVNKLNGSLPDGKKIVGELVVTVSDDGDTHTWTGQLTVGGEKADPVHDVWRRVSK